MIVLKPQDVAIALKILVTPPGWTIANLSESLFMSASEVHAGMQRAGHAQFLNVENRQVRIEPLREFIMHGLKYVFIANQGPITRGIPTSIAAPPLVLTHFDEPDLPPVWPHPMGIKRGYEITPLYRRAADAASADPVFYEMLALVDAIREGGSRVKVVAEQELDKRLQMYDRQRRLK
jgi:hypothetical protein